MVSTNDEATVTTVFNRTNGNISSIVATVVPIAGDVYYVRTSLISGNNVTTTYQELPKE